MCRVTKQFGLSTIMSELLLESLEASADYSAGHAFFILFSPMRIIR